MFRAAERELVIPRPWANSRGIRCRVGTVRVLSVCSCGSPAVVLHPLGGRGRATLCGTGFAPVLYNSVIRRGGAGSSNTWCLHRTRCRRRRGDVVRRGRERAALDGLGVPIVAVVGDTRRRLMRVGIDDVEGPRVATRHLVALGHRDIGLIGFEPEGTVGEDTASARRKGLAQALDEAGVSHCPEWTVERESTVRGGVRAAEDLLSLPRLPSAVFAMTDEMALGGGCGPCGGRASRSPARCR